MALVRGELTVFPRVISVIDEDEYWYLSTSDTECIGGEWTTEMPERRQGFYLWQKRVTTFSDDTTSETEPVCLTNAGENAILLRIDSTRGSILKNSAFGTVLKVYVFYGENQIANQAGLFAAFGVSAVIRWQYNDYDDTTWTDLNPAHPSLSDDGFTLTITPDMIDQKRTYRAVLVFRSSAEWVAVVGSAQVGTAYVGAYPPTVGVQAAFDQITVIDQSDGYSVHLSADSHTFTGNTTGVSATETFDVTVYGYCGGEQVGATVDLSGVVLPTGLSVTQVTGDAPVLTFTATTALTTGAVVEFPVTLGSVEITKSISIAIARSGAPSSVYSLVCSPNALVCDESGSIAPSSVTFSATVASGNGAPSAYSGRFKIEEYAGGWLTKYTSNTDESSKSYTPTSSSVTMIRGTLYKAGGTTVQLDVQAVPIVSDGAPGAPGEDGRGIASTEVKWQVGNSGTSVPTGTWQSSVPATTQGDFLWTRTVLTYTDGQNPSTSYSVAYIGTDGEDGKSVYVESATKTGKTTTVILSDGTTETTLTIDDGEDGDDGQPGAPGADGKPSYIHVAWANSADGVTDFSTSVSAGKKYIGVYTDQTQADSQTPSDYSWSLIKGADGADGYTVMLSNQSHTFSAGTTKAIAASTTTNIIAYKGTSSVAATVGTITGTINEKVTATATGSGTKNAYVTISVTDECDVANGVLTIPVTVDSKTFNLKFSWALSFAGDGVVSVTEQYGRSAASDAVPTTWYDKDHIPVLTSTERYLWNQTTTTYASGASASVGAHIIGVYGDTGDKGDDGVDGMSVVNIAEWYGTSVDAHVRPAKWYDDQHIPVTDADNRYLWNYEETTLSNGETTTVQTTTPAIIGVYGDNGAGVARVVTYYMLSDSAPEVPVVYPPGGDWSETEPEDNGQGGTLYYVDCTILTDDRWMYSAVSLDGSYQAAMKAQEAISNLRMGNRNYIRESMLMVLDGVHGFTGDTRDDTAKVGSAIVGWSKAAS